MSIYKQLKGYAYNIAHKFSCSAEYFCFMALRDNVPVLTIDLLTSEIKPESFDIERNQILVGHCRDNLLYLVNNHAVKLQNAKLTVYFTEDGYSQINSIRHEDGYYLIGSVRYEVILTDERGKNWVGVLQKANQLAIP